MANSITHRIWFAIVVFIVFCAVGACAGQQGVIHGNGDPSTLNPVPNCAASRFYVDDSTQAMYVAASGSPCSWVDAQGVNGTKYVTPNTAGADVGAKIATCLAALGNTRGICDAKAMAPVWPATATMSGFAMLPGQTVILGNGTYLVTSTATMQEGSRLIGQLGHSNGQGTVLKAANGLNADILQLQDAGGFLHWIGIENIQFDGNKANQTTGNCISALTPFGEPSGIHNVQTSNCKVDGFYMTGVSQATGFLDRVSSFGNGRYGFNFDDIAGTNTFIGLGGDDNGTALVHIKAEQSASITFLGMKAETKFAGVQPDMFLIEGTNGTPTITIEGGTADPSGAGIGATTNYVHIINGAVNLHLKDLWVNTNITNIIKDDVRTITIPTTLFTGFSGAGHITDILHSSVPTLYTAGSNPGIILGNNSRLGVLNGSGVYKDTLWADTGNVVHIKSAGGTGLSFDSSGTTGVVTITDSTGVLNATKGATTLSIAGTGTATFAAGASAGTTPGTPTCTTSHVCDSYSGTISFTMGTSTAAGIALTVTTSATRTNQASCVGAMYLAASPFTAIPIRMTATTTTAVFNTGTAPTASTAYELTYVCGGN